MIHIDTDVQEEKGFDVPRREAGAELSCQERVSRVIARIRTDIEEVFCAANIHRILFAVAVDSIECWLLPLLHANNKAEKTTGGLDAVNHELRRRGQKGLSGADGTKFPRAYDAASSDYQKRKVLVKHRDRNPSLKLFVDQLDALRSRPAKQEPAAIKEQSGSDVGGEKPPVINLSNFSQNN